jgi:hypothetical protein
MKNILAKFLIFFYSLGTIFLPMGDFSAIKDLPKMYEHCKATEDADMTVIDFITDHLINIDGIFDKHPNGDDQKPHNDVDFKLGNYTITLFFQEFNVLEFKTAKVVIESKVVISNYKKSIYSFNHIHFIFHPPIFA